jgi:chlorophyll(ide) b reductase
MYTDIHTNLRSKRRDHLICTAAFNVVVTGGSKGIGKSLAAEFVRAGDNVAICSRDAERVKSAVEELQALAATTGSSSSIKVCGLSANVARAKEIAAFADFAVEELGSVDIWINNAGTNGYAFKPLMDQTEDEIVSVVETNVVGVMLGCKEAIRVMNTQKNGGHVFNMDGAGADGGATPRFAAYGATKRSLEQFSKSLRTELKFAGVNNVGIHNLSPGMVTTELLMAGADNKVSKFFINCLAERPETVAEELVPKIRSVPGAQRTSILAAIGSGEYIRFLTKSRAYGNLLRRLTVGDRKDRFVDED